MSNSTDLDADNKALATTEPAQAPSTRHKWEKGISGNPKGRKPIDQDVKRALQAAHPQAVAKLVEIMTNPKSKTSDVIRCIEIVIERNMGKAAQPLVGPDGGAIQVAAVVLMPAPLNDG